MADKKHTARHALIVYSEQYFDCEWGRLNAKQRSEGLIRWYVEEVVNRTESRTLTEDDVNEALFDGAGDLGGDFYHRTSDGEVLIIQAKFRNTSRSEAVADLESFAGILDRLRQPAYKARAQKALRAFIDEIDWKTDRFDLRYLACAKLDGQCHVAAEDLASRAGRDDNPNVHLRFFSETELNTEYRSAIKLTAGLPSAQLFHVEKNTQVIDIPGATKSCVMVVPGKQIAQLYDEAKDALFATNIRSYLGDTKINKEIHDTINREPHYFYYYNNGITCLSTSFDMKNEREVNVTGLQVINGAQTVRALAKAEKQKPGATDKVLVLMRVTELKKGYGEEGRFISNIVRSNNSQNAMKPADFISNDAIQGWLRQQFGKARRLGKEVVYLNKRSATDGLGKEVIPIEDFAKSIYSFLFDPVKFSSGSTFFFAHGRDKGYFSVFGTGEELFDPPMAEPEFRLRSAIWWLSKEFATAMKVDKKTGQYGAALERKHYVLFASRIILERNFGADYKKVLAKYYKGDWRINDTSVPGPFFRRLYELARQTVVYQFKQDEKRDGDAFNQRNWMRSPLTRDAIQVFCSEGPGLDGLAELIGTPKASAAL
jgi:hypothetical protein